MAALISLSDTLSFVVTGKGTVLPYSPTFIALFLDLGGVDLLLGERFFNGVEGGLALVVRRQAAPTTKTTSS